MESGLRGSLAHLLPAGVCLPRNDSLEPWLGTLHTIPLELLSTIQLHGLGGEAAGPRLPLIGYRPGRSQTAIQLSLHKADCLLPGGGSKAEERTQQYPSGRAAAWRQEGLPF